MKLSIKDWLLLFISFVIGGVGLIPGIQSLVAYTLIIIGGSGIISILGFNIYRTHIKTKNEKDNSDYFPRLNINMLKQFAKRVVNKYPGLPFIDIILYRYHSPHFSNDPAKYAIVLKIDSSTKRSPQLMRQFEALQYGTGYLQTVPDPDSSYELGIDASFEDIYKEKPEKDFRNEWAFYAITSDDAVPLGIMTEEKTIILYKSTHKKV